MGLDFDAPVDDGAALLRAQELGCLPETALALVVFTDYRLVGSDADAGILRTETAWPTAWRIHAARCHRALATGCTDDVDLLLRILSEWQTSHDPDGWCATWWVNPATLARIETDVASVFAGLATAGPLGMRHPVDRGRSPQVRTVLAESYEGAEFLRVGAGRYRLADDESGEPFTPSPAVLVSPGERFIAFGRDPGARVVEHVITLDAHPVPPVDVLAAVRAMWPVGSIADIDTLGSVAAGRIVIDMLAVERGFPLPGGAVPLPGYPRNDVPELVAAPTYASAPIDTASKMRVRITGYRIFEDNTAVLVVDPLTPGAPLDPAHHPDLGTWDDVEVVVRGLTADHSEALLELGRADGLGSFFVAPAAGLGADDGGFAARLREGARLTVRVIPEPSLGDALAVSLLPAALRHLRATFGADDHKPLPARVVERNPAQATLTVELAQHDTVTGMSHRFTFGSDRLADGFDPAVGTEVEAVIRPDRSERRRRIAVNPDLVRFADRHRDTFEVVEGRLRMAPSPPQIPAFFALLSPSSSLEWERELVWMYEDNLHLEVVVVGEPGLPLLARIAAESPGFLPPQPVRSELASAVKDAAPATAAALPMIVAWLPPGGRERVQGAAGSALTELRVGPGVVSVDLEGDTVTVVGETGGAVRSVIAEIQRLILPAKGKLIVPPGQGRRLVGIDGTTLRAIEANTGCVAAEPPTERAPWTVEGPSSQAVKEFIRLAAEQVPGVVGRVTGFDDLQVLDDRTGSVPSSPATTQPRPAPTPAPPSSPKLPARLGDDAATHAPAAAPAKGITAAPAGRTAELPLTTGGGDVESAVDKRKAKRPRKERQEKPPKVRTGPGILTWVMRGLLVLVVGGGVALAALFVIPLARAWLESATSATPPVVETTVVTAEASPFATLVDASSVTPSSCWLAVVATWTDEEAAARGVERLGTIGLTASALASDLVPGWSPGRFVAAVPVETQEQARDTVARAAGVGFSGVAVESDIDRCVGLDIVPAGASLGFIDVPSNHAAHTAIRWMADTGLATTCAAADGDLFCPADPVTRGELEAILRAALTAPPALATADPTAPATMGDLEKAIGLPGTGSTDPLTRADVAVALLLAYQTLGG